MIRIRGLLKGCQKGNVENKKEIQRTVKGVLQAENDVIRIEREKSDKQNNVNFIEIRWGVLYYFSYFHETICVSSWKSHEQTDNFNTYLHLFFCNSLL